MPVPSCICELQPGKKTFSIHFESYLLESFLSGSRGPWAAPWAAPWRNDGNHVEQEFQRIAHGGQNMPQMLRRRLRLGCRPCPCLVHLVPCRDLWMIKPLELSQKSVHQPYHRLDSSLHIATSTPVYPPIDKPQVHDIIQCYSHRGW